MRNIALLIEYDGTAYCGWQIQNNGKSIQGTIEKFLREILRENVKITGAGRTDAGAHAVGQVANFHTHSEWGVEKIVYALNRVLPHDIAIHNGAIVPDEFHSRYDAVERRYIYRVVTRKSPLSRQFVAHFHYDLSLGLMNEAAGLLVGERSFRPFSKNQDEQRSFICNVKKAEWQEGKEANEKDSFLFARSAGLLFDIEANRFLHGMVRAIVGSMIDVGRGRISVEDFKRVLSSEDRSTGSMSAPALGLCLEEVTYLPDPWND